MHSVGTAASSRGVATVLKRYDPDVKVVCVEPGESAVLSGGEPGPHKIEGVGIGYEPPLWDPSLVDDILTVPTADAKAMAGRRQVGQPECGGLPPPCGGAGLPARGAERTMRGGGTAQGTATASRSEERRVGKECRSRGAP